MQTLFCEICGKEPLIRVGPDRLLQQCGRCGSVQAGERITTQVYDEKYVAERYERYETTDEMSRLRLLMIHSVLFLFDYDRKVQCLSRKRDGYRLLDVGFGNGSFIRHAIWDGWDAYGHDVNPTEYPLVKRKPLPIDPLPAEERYRVITFFDCLEHFETLQQVREISRNTDWIFISIPSPPYVWWMAPQTWRHYRPGEHHFYPEPSALATLFSLPDVLVEAKWTGAPEDLIRGPLPDGNRNIATVALRCYHDRS